MSCYLCNNEILFYYSYAEYLSGKQRRICEDCFLKINKINFIYENLFYTHDLIKFHDDQRRLFYIKLFSYKNLKITFKYEINKAKFNANYNYLYDFRIGV
jgi:hypothetical protein